MKRARFTTSWASDAFEYSEGQVVTFSNAYGPETLPEAHAMKLLEGGTLVLVTGDGEASAPPAGEGEAPEEQAVRRGARRS